MTGRGVDQALPRPSRPELREPYAQSAMEYLALAERVNGPVPKPVDAPYVWGDALEELSRFAPDVRIINLETSVTVSDDWEPKGINYRMHPANIACLTAAKIDCCVLANNHVLDFGCRGLLETMDVIRGAGIETAGGGRNLAEAMEPAIIDAGSGTRALVFGAATSDSGIDRSWAAAAERAGVMLLEDLAADTAQGFVERVRSIKRSGDAAILSIHWGGNWGYSIPHQQQLFAHRLIDSGVVDVIHGHSSHHPKGIEIYESKLILYGCGDFINDYEGISEYESFRGNLAIAYFATIDPATGRLLRLEMPSFGIKRFRLTRASYEERKWLQDALTREGRELGTEAREQEGCLALAWPG